MTVREKRDQLGNKLFWNQWIIVVTESFVIVTLVAAIHFKYSDYFTESGVMVQTITCIAAVCFYVFLPTLTFLMLLKRFIAL